MTYTNYQELLFSHNFVGGANKTSVSVDSGSSDVRANVSQDTNDIWQFYYFTLTSLSDFNALGYYDTPTNDENSDSLYDREHTYLPGGNDPSLSAVQLQAIQNALHTSLTDDYSATFEDIATIQFNVGTTASADIVFGATTSGGHVGPTTGAYERDYSDPLPLDLDPELMHGDIWLNNDYTAMWDNASEGSLAHYAAMHEISHALGIDLYRPENRVDPTKPYEADQTKVNYNPLTTSASAFDSMKYTVTSYNFLEGMEPAGPNNEVAPFGLQLLDIAAIQEIYGRNYDTRDENNTEYSKLTAFGSSRPNDAFIYTIWDGGGSGDVIDASGYDVKAYIDLRQGNFSSIGKTADSGYDGHTDYADFSFAQGQAKENVAIAFYSIIENAIGTSEDDVLIGNAWNNRLEGGDGADKLYGDGVVYDTDAGFHTDDPNEVGDPNESAPSDDSGVDTLIGGGGSDELYGGAGNDHLRGGSGDDLLNGGDGTGDRAICSQDRLDGATGHTTAILNADNSITSVIDGWGNTDTLTGIEIMDAGSSAYDVLRDETGGLRNIDSWTGSPQLNGFEILELSNVDDTITNSVISGGPEIGTIDAKGGYDTYDHSIAGTGFMHGGNVYADDLTLKGFEYIDGSGTGSTIVVSNLSAGHGNYETRDYTTMSEGVWIQSTTIRHSDYPIDPSQGFYDFEQGGSLKTLALTNFDDRLDISSASVIEDIYLGSGNDQVTGQHNNSKTREIHYTGGEDIVSDLGSGTSIQLGAGISTSDLLSVEFILPTDAYSDPGTLYGAVIKYTFDGFGSVSVTGNVGSFDGPYGYVTGGGTVVESNHHDMSIVFEDGSYISGNPYTVNTPDGTWADRTGTTFDAFDVHKADIIDHTSSGSAVDIDTGYGSDIVTGSGQADTLRGNVGDDKISGGLGQDTIYGGAGSDTLFGADDTSEDMLYGGDGNDVIHIKGDIATGGAGSDTFVIHDGISTIKDFDPLEDTLNFANIGTVDNLNDISFIDFSSSTRLSGGTFQITLEGVTSSDLDTGNTFMGTEYIPAPDVPDPVLPTYPTTPTTVLTGTSGDDELEADWNTATKIVTLDGYDTAYGSQYDDVLEGGAGDDWLEGNEGNDLFKPGDGDDYVHLGDGNDIVELEQHASTSYDISIDDGGGLDYLVLPSVYSTSTISFSDFFGQTRLTATAFYDGAWHSTRANFYIEDDPLSDEQYAVEYLVVGGVAYDMYWVVNNGFTYTHDPNPPAANPNDAPTALDDDVSVVEGYLFSGNVFDDNGNGVDFDTNGVSLTATAQSSYISGIGQFDLSTNGDFTLQPIVGVSASTYAISYDIEDAGGNSASADINLTISGTDDQLYSDTAGETLNGGLGNDTVAFLAASSGVTANLTSGTATGHGNDTLLNIENLTGSTYGDSLTGDANANILYGLAGNDTLMGEVGDDTLDGGDGDDTLNGGDGIDTASYTNDTDRVLIDLTNNLARQEWNGTSGTTLDTLSSIENAVGSAYNDVIHGSAGANLLQGGNGRDNIQGWAGNDTLEGGLDDDLIFGGDGDDIIHGGDGDDKSLWSGGVKLYDGGLYGGAGNDTIYGDGGNDVIYGESGDDEIHGGDGDDIIYADYQAPDASDGSDIVYGDAGNDTIVGSGGDDDLYGGDGNDLIHGGGGEDEIWGGDGSDTIYGNDDDDIIRGGAGSDTMYGNGGFDTIYGDAGNDFINGQAVQDIIYGGDDNDVIWGYEDGDILEGGNGSDIIYGDDQFNTVGFVGAGNDTIRGNAGNDSLFGGDGNDTIYGGTENDTLYGTQGNDTLYGDEGTDILYGDWSGGTTANDGNDTLRGGAGSDTLVGGGGADMLYADEGIDKLWGQTGIDTFIFEGETAFDGRDLVRDFEAGEKIDIADVLSDYGYVDGTDVLSDWVQITYAGAHSFLEVDRDGTGTAHSFNDLMYTENYSTLAMSDLITV